MTKVRSWKDYGRCAVEPAQRSANTPVLRQQHFAKRVAEQQSLADAELKQENLPTRKHGKPIAAWHKPNANGGGYVVVPRVSTNPLFGDPEQNGILCKDLKEVRDFYRDFKRGVEAGDVDDRIEAIHTLRQRSHNGAGRKTTSASTALVKVMR